MTEDDAAAAEFFARLDSAILMRNASTQFADGGEFGMGAEIGIATGRMHARGPVGLEQLTSFHYLVRGTGQMRPAEVGVPILKALGRQSTVLPGWLTKLLVGSLRTVPRWAKVRIMKMVMGGMTKHQIKGG